jgi:hypothetical protein
VRRKNPKWSIASPAAVFPACWDVVISLPKSIFLCNFRLICPVQSYQEKDSTLLVGQIITTSSPRPAPLPEGRFAIVTKRWARDAMDALAQKANELAADGEAVWS